MVSSTTVSEGHFSRDLAIAWVLTVGFCVLEILGSVRTHSLSVRSDGFHMASDALSLTLTAFTAVWMGRSNAPARVERIAVWLNCALITFLLFNLGHSAYLRFLHPVAPESVGVIAFGIVGFIVNLVVLGRLGGHRHDSLNVRGAYLHVLGDCLASVGVFVSGVIEYCFGSLGVDPIMTLIICGIMFVGLVNLIRENCGLGPERADCGEPH